MTIDEQFERAILVGCGTKSGTSSEQLHTSLEELARLADTARAQEVARVVQLRERLDSAWLIGRGKAEELVRMVEEKEADLVLFDQELSPSQLAHLEDLLPCKVLDRTQLILDIFAMRARTKEGVLQVELAQMEYLLPRLTGRGKELSRLGGGIGTRGPGEKKLETDRRHIRRRIRDLKAELDRVRQHRQLHQARRRKMNVVQVALVGYTNAGKSTLLNRLTGADVLTEDRLFATLDPTSRFCRLPSGEDVLLTDTVGFIRHLPHHLVAAFRSTLEQVREADLLLHVVDKSHPEAPEQIRAVEEVLVKLDASHIPVLTVLNKADRSKGELLTADGESIEISAFRDSDLERLKQTVDRLLVQVQVRGSAEIPVSRGELISRLYQLADVTHSEVDGLMMKVNFHLPRRRYEQMSAELKEYMRDVVRLKP
ncbi:GTPase HflX [Desmospora profundinema]|uniref:GTPase HflX n=1 Tax=Desmospora profundinema TaxID=1571184 RepID=A0ABU1IHN4_9BACL|nr:GTPase HflX [Desmospora profundinema]MDR6224284.1 GTP-binding protein HflX [Desmospora profundinema]